LSSRGALSLVPAGADEKASVLKAVTALVSAGAPEMRRAHTVVRTKLSKPYQIDNAAPVARPAAALGGPRATVLVPPSRGRRFALESSRRFRREAAARAPARAAIAPAASASSSSAEAGRRPAPAIPAEPRLTWAAALAMHARWRAFAVEYLASAARSEPRLAMEAARGLDLTFAYAAVTRCDACPEHDGSPLIVVNETRSAFSCITPTSRRVALPKRGTWLAVPIPDSTRGAEDMSGGPPEPPTPGAGIAAVLECNGSEMLRRGGGAPWLR